MKLWIFITVATSERGAGLGERLNMPEIPPVFSCNILCEYQIHIPEIINNQAKRKPKDCDHKEGTFAVSESSSPLTDNFPSISCTQQRIKAGIDFKHT